MSNPGATRNRLRSADFCHCTEPVTSDSGTHVSASGQPLRSATVVVEGCVRHQHPGPHPECGVGVYAQSCALSRTVSALSGSVPLRYGNHALNAKFLSGARPIHPNVVAVEYGQKIPDANVSFFQRGPAFSTIPAVTNCACAFNRSCASLNAEPERREIFCSRILLSSLLAASHSFVAISVSMRSRLAVTCWGVGLDSVQPNATTLKTTSDTDQSRRGRLFTATHPRCALTHARGGATLSARQKKCRHAAMDDTHPRWSVGGLIVVTALSGASSSPTRCHRSRGTIRTHLPISGSKIRSHRRAEGCH